MNNELLSTANKLNKKIQALEWALRSFEWIVEDPDGGEPQRFSTNPRLIIEYDGGDGREQEEIPMILNDDFIRILKEEIMNELRATKITFENL